MGRLLNEDDVYALFAPNGTARLHVADIDVLPRVDAKEVVHGWWIDENGFLFMPLPKGHRWYHCSECREMIIGIPHNYYPNCGAKMDGDGNA